MVNSKTSTLQIAEGTEPATLVDVQTVAAMLDCSTRHVYRLSDAGKMPSPLKLGALVRWRRDDIMKWIASGCRPVRLPG